MTNKIDVVKSLLTKPQGTPDVLFIVETWLDDTYSDQEMSIHGYVQYRKDRADKEEGGILMSMRQSLKRE